MKDIQYLSTRDIAQIYQIDEETARRWCKSGKIKAKKIGKMWFIPRDEENSDESNQ